jgi:APA family basic amino acid/polyamine antiporter
MTGRDEMQPQRVGSLALFSLVYTTSAAALYFALGLVAGRALGLTPVVFLVGGLFLGLAAMTYAEGALGHPEPGGSSALARYGFNELVSFAAGWAVVLDFLVVMALAATSAAAYLGTIWSPVSHGTGRALVACGVILFAVVSTTLGSTTWGFRNRVIIAIADIGVQSLLLVIGVALLLDPSVITKGIDLGSSPSWANIIYALTLVTVAFTGVEAAASLAPEIRLKRSGVIGMISGGVAVVVILQVGVAAVALSAFPVEGGKTLLSTEWLDAPLVGVARAVGHGQVGKVLGWVVAASGFLALVAATRSAMLGVSRLAYSLARHRQIPRIVARLGRRRGTPWLIILLSGLAAAALAIPGDIKMLGGIYAFGAMLAITIAHASVVRMRLRGELSETSWRMPLSLKTSAGSLPLPAVVGAVLSAAAFVGVVIVHQPARWVGGAWLITGVLLYIIYRRLTGNSILRSVEVSDRALIYEAESASYGSILVPILGTELDDDIVQTAGRLAGSHDEDLDESGPVIEALWFHEIPLALPLDAALPSERTDVAKERLRRAKAVGEEYQGVTVSTAQVRVRTLGEGIVREAKRRGVDVIVLTAEDPAKAAKTSAPTRGRQAGLGETTRFVLRKAPCRVVVTVPSTNFEGTRSLGEDDPQHSTE